MNKTNLQDFLKYALWNVNFSLSLGASTQDMINHRNFLVSTSITFDNQTLDVDIW